MASTKRIDDYALLGNTRTAALLSRQGSLDWMCAPRFDSGACFAALLGDESNGSWVLAPADPAAVASRRYLDDSAVVETVWESESGAVRVVDFMPPHPDDCEVIRIVEGIRGQLTMTMHLTVRFDYGSIVPWVRRVEGGTAFVAGPDAFLLRSSVQCHGEGLSTVASFDLGSGDRASFGMVWYPSHLEPPPARDLADALTETLQWWRDWVDGGSLARDDTLPEHWRAAALRSLITLKALTYGPTGGIVAAPTTSLPEEIGGSRNWDYRACWLRDSTFTLFALLHAGHADEARAWFRWLLRAAGGDAESIQIMYGPSGERRLTEIELPWLPGFLGSRPVRIGNAASEQFQLDVWGEVLDSFFHAQLAGIEFDGSAWDLATTLVEYVEQHWTDPDHGIWEMRGPKQHFTHSKVMAWVALDRAVRCVESFGHPGPVGRWRACRDAIHADICKSGFNSDAGTFTQTYGSSNVDASLLQIPLVGFLPCSDERVAGTISAIRTGLADPSGLIRRYDPTATADGLGQPEGAFLACTCWMVDALALSGQTTEAAALLERVLVLSNDVGLLAEEYDAVDQRMLGNFPQAFSHVAIVNSIRNLSADSSPAVIRSTR